MHNKKKKNNNEFLKIILLYFNYIFKITTISNMGGGFA